MKIDQHKPKMKTLASFSALTIIPGQTVVMGKLDGEFTYICYSGILNDSYTLNRWGRQRKDFPALNEFTAAMQKTKIKTVELLCEMHAVKDDGLPLPLPKYIHYIKSKDPELIKMVRIGFFDLISINGAPVNQNYSWKMDEVASWIKDTRNYVIPYIKPSTIDEVETFWNQKVTKEKYEGLVARSNSDTYKIKPISDLDAVIIGINKKTLFYSKQVTSIKLALMDPQGHFVEIGDCASGISHKLRSSLWDLMKYKVGEDSKIVWVKPMVICQIEYTDLFKGQNKMFSFDGSSYTNVGQTPMVRMKHPRLVGFRSDKKVCYDDLRVEQVPLEFGKDVWNIAGSLGQP